VHPITTHAHKGAAGKALERAHHTASPGAKRRQRRRALRVSGSAASGMQTVMRHPWRNYIQALINRGKESNYG